VTPSTAIALGLCALLLLGAGAAAGLAYALVRVSRQPPTDLETALGQLRSERVREKAEMLEVVERMVDAGETLDRRRARAETAEQRRKQGDEKRGEGDAPVLTGLDAVRARARSVGKL
jgi:hypothetical protein